MSLKPFQFKQFTIAQDKCAMKIGTDGVLLGAWVSLHHQPDSILDIGTGTGVIALQLAQRCESQRIDAIEIDTDAYIQATQNFETSAWGDRLFCFHGAVQDFTQELLDDASEEGYDLIVANPPFYTDDYKTVDTSRNKARFTDTLPFQHLAICAANLLMPQGIFALVLPKKEAATFITLAHEYDLYLQRKCEVKGNPTSDVKRVLLEFSFIEKPLEVTQLIIENSRHDYTEAYKALVQDFYFKM